MATDRLELHMLSPFTSTVRRRVAFALMLGATAVLACERAHDAIVAPAALAPQAPTRAVVAGQNAHFYIHGHPGNWSLFMGDHVPSSLGSATEVVFVTLSTGDANLGMSYAQTREAASRAAIDALLGGAGSWSCASVTVRTHPILRCARGVAVAYFLRLPDGAPTGTGYAALGSMGLLRDGTIPSLTALDASTTYTSWSDLTTTLRALVDLEGASQAAPYIEIHTPDNNRTTNAGDHPDNLATADAVNAAAATRQWNIFWYVDAATQALPQNLTQAAHDIKQSAFYAYDGVMASAGYGFERYDSSIQAWLWRTYFRSTVAAPSGPPTAPSAFTTQAFSSSRVDLAWTATSLLATAYDVERAPDVNGVAGTFALAGSAGATSTSYSDTGLTPTTTYWYRIRARNSAGMSPYTAVSGATTLAAPPAPTGLVATAATGGQIDLAWTDNAANETGYAIERAPDVAGVAGAWTPLTTVAANVTTYSNTGLASSTRYWYRVRTVTLNDVSAYSASTSALTTATASVPSGLTATAASASRINLAWTDSPDETSYVLQRAPDAGTGPGAFAALATLGANVTSYADQTGLAPLTRYWYRIASTNAVGTSAFSAAVSATTLATLPLAPTTFVARAVSFSQVDLTWVDNASNETSYAVDRAPDNAGRAGSFKLLVTLPANSTGYSNYGLLGSTRYWYRVRAINAAGSTAVATNANATTLSQAGARTDFYINAHEDDWMLFAGDVAAGSIAGAPKVVIVYVTAGDNDRSTAYWHMRETASLAGTDAVLPTTGSWLCAAQTLLGHGLRRCSRANVVAYYMRLPDGGPSGDGFQDRGSLAYLRDGVVGTVSDLTWSDSYTWTDLVNTARAIVDLESANQSAPFVEIHAPDADRTLNAGDHSDHLAVGDMLVAASATRRWNFNWYVQYATQSMPVNLAQPAHDTKQNIFVTYDNVMGRAGYGYLQYDAPYQAWLWRTYARRVVAP